MLHDGSHFTLARSGKVNELLAHLGAAHLSLFTWSHQHIIGHHSATNMAGRDPDLYQMMYAFNTEVPGFRTSLELRPLPEQTGFYSSRAQFWKYGLLLRMF